MDIGDGGQAGGSETGFGEASPSHAAAAARAFLGAEDLLDPATDLRDGVVRCGEPSIGPSLSSSEERFSKARAIVPRPIRRRAMAAFSSRFPKRTKKDNAKPDLLRARAS
jgi:hypothetical protein